MPSPTEPTPRRPKSDASAQQRGGASPRPLTRRPAAQVPPKVEFDRVPEPVITLAEPAGTGASKALMLAAVGLCILAGAMLTFSPIAFALAYEPIDSPAISVAAGTGIGRLIIVSIVAGIVWLIARRRVPLAALLTFSSLAFLIAIIGALGAVIAHRKPAPNPVKIADAQVRSLIDDRDAKVASGNFSGQDQRELSHNLNQTIKTLAENVSGDEKLFVQAMVELNDAVTPGNAAYLDAMNRFNESGGMDVKSIKSRDEIAGRIALLDRATKLAEAMHTTQAGAVERVKKYMSEHGSARPEVYLTQIGFPAMRRYEVELATQEIAVCKAMRPYLIELYDSYSHWSFRGGRVIFESSAPLGTVVRFNEAIQRIGQAAAEQQRVVAAQKEFLASRPKPK